LNESEAGDDIVLIETFPLFLCHDVVLKLISANLHKKSREVSIKARSPPAPPPFKGQATKRTTAKWSIQP